MPDTAEMLQQALAALRGIRDRSTTHQDAIRRARDAMAAIQGPELRSPPKPLDIEEPLPRGDT